MTKVTMVDSENTDNLIQNECSFIDKQGRKFVLKKPDLLDQYDLMRALGKDADIAGCITLATPLVCIKSINDEKFYCPQSNLELRAALKRIGSETMTQILNALVENKLIMAEENKEEQKEELKK